MNPPEKSNSFSETKPNYPSIQDGSDDENETPARDTQDRNTRTEDTSPSGTDSNAAASGSRKGKQKEVQKEWTEEQDEVVDRVMQAKFNYQILGVPPGTNNKETLKNKYKKLAFALHPDGNKHPQAEEAFKSR